MYFYSETIGMGWDQVSKGEWKFIAINCQLLFLKIIEFHPSSVFYIHRLEINVTLALTSKSKPDNTFSLAWFFVEQMKWELIKGRVLREAF